MNIDVELLNVVKYERKEDKKPRTMIRYRVLDSKSLANNEKFKGYSVLDAYFDGHEVFEKLPCNICGCAVKMQIEKSPSVYDPLKEQTIIKKINDISLV